MTRNKVVFVLVAVATMAFLAQTATAEIRQVKIYRATQITSQDVVLTPIATSDALVALAGASNAQLSPETWRELQRAELTTEREPRQVLDDDGDPGGFTDPPTKPKKGRSR